jgi:Zn-dependent protease with chaperone function
MRAASVRILLALFFLFMLVPGMLQAQNYIAKIYCAFLGNDNATSEYQTIAREALQAFGVHDFDQVPIKKMSFLPKKVLGDGVVSFTMQGIWIDEELLTECPFEEVIFTIYHEAAHYALRDHAKELLLLIPASMLFYGVPQMTKDVIDPGYRIARFGYISLASLFMIMVLDRVLMRPAVRRIERRAEREAVRILCLMGKECIVHGHLEYLQSLIKQGHQTTGLWRDSLADRIKDISLCLHEFAPQEQVLS